MNRARLLLLTDSLIFCTFLIAAGIELPFAYAPWQGLQDDFWKIIHKVSGMLLFAGVVTHLVLHARWIATTAKRFLKSTSRPAKINFCVDLLLGWVFLLICLSGINQWAASLGNPTLFQIDRSIWKSMHLGTGTAMSVYVIIHLVLHGRWIKNTLRIPFKRYSDQKQLRFFTENLVNHSSSRKKEITHD